MKNAVVGARNKTGGFIYQKAYKPMLFKKDPEEVHDRFVKAGRVLASNPITRGMSTMAFSYSNPKMLSQTIKGIEFKNPIGLAAGFDKEAHLTRLLPSLGFGFEEVGSVTKNPYEGNDAVRLHRLKKSGGIIVNYGLKNDGADVIYDRLKPIKHKFPIGINIAKTNSKETVDTTKGVEDYFYTYQKFHDVGDYFTINISCPNAFGGLPFNNAKDYDKLMKKLFSIEKTKPVFIKLSPDLDRRELDDLLKVSDKYPIDGFIISNLTKNRKNSKIVDPTPVTGGISGKVVKELTDKMIKYVYQKTKGKYIIIGLGGVFTAQDAYKKIKLGASLCQLVTGMIFMGPFQVSEINRELVRLLKKDGYTNISQAIGVDNKIN